MKIALLEANAFRTDRRATAAAVTLALHSKSTVVFVDVETANAIKTPVVEDVRTVDISEHAKFGRFLDFHGLARAMKGRDAVALRVDTVDARLINVLIDGWYRLAYWQECPSIVVIIANEFSAPELASRMAFLYQSLGHPRAASYARAMSRTLIATGIAEIMGGGVWVSLVNLLFRSPQKIRRRYLGN